MAHGGSQLDCTQSSGGRYSRQGGGEAEEFADVLVEDLPPGLPPRRAVGFETDLESDHTPPHCHPYRMEASEQQVLYDKVDVLLEKDHVRVSNSPFGVPTLNVPKKDGTIRVCMDYRTINKMMRKNKTSLQNIDDVFDTLQGAAIFSKIDLASVYHQIRIKEGDEHKTVFTTQFGHFEWLVMPFGLTNAPAVFMTLMNDVLRPLINKTVAYF